MHDIIFSDDDDVLSDLGLGGSSKNKQEKPHERGKQHERPQESDEFDFDDSDFPGNLLTHLIP